MFLEKKDDYLCFGRQFGSYPILVATAEKLELKQFYDFMIVNHGLRSLTAITQSINLNTIDYSILKTVSGISKKQANKIIANRPFIDYSDFIQKTKISNEFLEKTAVF